VARIPLSRSRERVPGRAGEGALAARQPTTCPQARCHLPAKTADVAVGTPSPAPSGHPLPRSGRGESVPGGGNLLPGGGNLLPGAGNFLPGEGNLLPEAGNFLPRAGNFLPKARNALLRAGNFLPAGGNFLPEKAVFSLLARKRAFWGKVFLIWQENLLLRGGNFLPNVGNSLHGEGNLLPGEGRSSLWGANAPSGERQAGGTPALPAISHPFACSNANRRAAPISSAVLLSGMVTS
jgi:hypothetical protein